MGKVREQRAEKRLRYRWHARFASNPKQKPLSGQMVDISSKGMALLYHADENCPKPDQFITTNFGVPYFDSEDSFDTVFFNRIGRVCRIDKLTSKVNRIAVQFAEPLFFKPGEQNISDSDIKKRLEAKAQLIVSGKEKTVAKAPAKVKEDNKTKSTAEETERAYSEALARAEERIRSYAEAKIQAEEKLKTEIEAKARAEEKAKAETRARTEAETKAKTEARLRAKAEKKAKTEAEKRAKIEAELREKTKRKPKTQQKKAIEKKSTQGKTKRSGEGVLMEKIDKFITDRNKIF
ncbi:MAG: PilZ domain-containing protein [Sedimentisphaerales bacterium]|nr:PilZ domain-containing protein [Sedimentisphaerales bacterium]